MQKRSVGCTRSVEANRNFPFAHFDLAAALRTRGELDEARASAAGGPMRAFNPIIPRQRSLSQAHASTDCQNIYVAGLDTALEVEGEFAGAQLAGRGCIGARMSDPMAVSRRLVAVFAADVEGYSRLMGADEVGTLKGLTERRAILDRFIGEHRGRIANTAGDSVLAEFGSAVDAVQCAVEAQTALAEANSSLAPDRRISFRIGIHIGDVMVRGWGPVRRRREHCRAAADIAKPGGVCISGATYDQVRKVLPITFHGPWCFSR